MLGHPVSCPVHRAHNTGNQGQLYDNQNVLRRMICLKLMIKHEKVWTNDKVVTEWKTNNILSYLVKKGNGNLWWKAAGLNDEDNIMKETKIV